MDRTTVGLDPILNCSLLVFDFAFGLEPFSLLKSIEILLSNLNPSFLNELNSVWQ